MNKIFFGQNKIRKEKIVRVILSTYNYSGGPNGWSFSMSGLSNPRLDEFWDGNYEFNLVFSVPSGDYHDTDYGYNVYMEDLDDNPSTNPYTFSGAAVGGSYDPRGSLISVQILNVNPDIYYGYEYYWTGKN